MIIPPDQTALGDTARACSFLACPARYEAVAVMEGTASAEGWRPPVASGPFALTMLPPQSAPQVVAVVCPRSGAMRS